MSQAVTRAAYRFVDAQENYANVNDEVNSLYDKHPDLQFVSDEYEDRWAEAWEEYSAARDNLIQTVNVERSGVKLG